MNLPSGKNSGLPRLTIEKTPRLRTLLENFHDVMKHRVTAHPAVAGAPFEMLEGRTRTGKLGRAQSLSLAVHIGAIVALALLLHNATTNPIIPPRPPISATPLLPVIPTVPDPNATPKNMPTKPLGLPWMPDVNGSQGPGGPEGYGPGPGHTMGNSLKDGIGGWGNVRTPYAAGA